MAFQPVPTYADPVEVDERTGKHSFSPKWLSWFLTLTGGGLAQTITHGSLAGLQGGASGDYYHLTAAQLATVNYRSSAAPSNITVTASAFKYQNTEVFDIDVIVSGGTVTVIEFSRDDATYYTIGLIAGMFRLSPSDFLRVTYAVAPTMTKVPR